MSTEDEHSEEEELNQEEANSNGNEELSVELDGLDENGISAGGDDNIVSLSGMYEEWFLDYASYVILERAVPALED